MSLREVQELFWRAITWPTGTRDFLRSADAATRAAFERTFDETATFDRTARVDVYAQAYFWRLFGVLEGQFPRLKTLVGADAFHDLVTDTVLERPSIDPDIRSYGARLVESVAGHALRERFACLPDLARLEWALADVLDVFDDPAVRLEDLATHRAEDWPALTFRLSRTLRWIDSRHPLDEIVRACDASAPSTSPPAPRDEPSTFVVHRRGHAPVFRRTTQVEAAALRTAARGASFEAVCSAAVERHATATPDSVARLVTRWVEDGLVTGVA